MEVRWCLTDRTYENENYCILHLNAQHFIEVQGKKQLFRFSYETKLSEDLKYQIEHFTERAKDFFDFIEKALKSLEGGDNGKR